MLLYYANQLRYELILRIDGMAWEMLSRGSGVADNHWAALFQIVCAGLACEVSVSNFPQKP